MAGSMPACSSRLYSRHGTQLEMSLAKLSEHFNQRLQAAHSNLQNLRLEAEGTDKLTISGEKNGQPVSISGPLMPTPSGGLQLHATAITRNGTPEKGVMDLFGKNLSDFVKTNDTPSLSATGNNLEINVDRLLGVAGHVTGVQLHGSQIEMQFASQPCQ